MKETVGILRNINFYLQYSHNCTEVNARNRYDGVARFFRAYFYFEKVKRYGDIPWYDKALDSDDPELYKANLPYKRIYPIPSSEINANKLMEQNPGNN